MSKQSHQEGSAQIIVTILLVVALLSGLSYVLYQNFVTNQRNSNTQTATAANGSANIAQIEAESKKTECTKLEKICYEYPATWTSSTTYSTLWKGTSNETTQEKVELKSDDGVALLYFMNAISQIGGWCDEKSKDEYTTVASVQTGLTLKADDYKSKEVYALKAILKNSNGYSAKVALTNLKSVESVGDHGNCVMYEAILGAKNTASSGSMEFSSQGFGSGVPPEYYATYDEALAVLNSTEYSKAFDILKSAHYK